ncbi:hypothetical protein QBB34_47900 [Streptomyces stelliscabiei]|uniref:hypothetical protein n=1 Tax=Streptomyces stelliscabiei TaxID=146820 RepID=UPI002FF15936
MTSPSLTIDTPAGPVRATAGPREADAVGSSGRGDARQRARHRHHPPPPLGPVHRRTRLSRPRERLQDHRPDEDLPQLARGRTGYRAA